MSKPQVITPATQEKTAVEEFAGLNYRPGVLDLKSQHLIAWSAALLADCQP